MTELKAATPADGALLADLGRRTFVETFAATNKAEDVEKYCAETYTEAKQRAEIADPKRRLVIARVNGEAVGFSHLLVETDDVIELLRIYVDSAWHGKGVAAALMNGCLESARREGFKTIKLGVADDNHRARAFYKKYGFVDVGTHVFKLGDDEQIDLVMERKL